MAHEQRALRRKLAEPAERALPARSVQVSVQVSVQAAWPVPRPAGLGHGMRKP
jgi:hypothetical protein